MFILETGRPPAPPPEWSAVKQRRLDRCIRAAYLFLVKQKDIAYITAKLGNAELTKARVAQLIARGCKFFLDRNFISKKNY